MTSTLDFPHHSSENTLQEGSASHPVEAHAHSALPATAQAAAVHSGLDATATGSTRADSPVFAWLKASAQTVCSAATALRDEARQHRPAPKEVAALGMATLHQLSIAAEEVRSFFVAETTQTLLSNTMDSCISLSSKAFKSIAGPLVKLPVHTSDASAFVLKWASAAVPDSRVLCSAALAKLQDLGSALWQGSENAGAAGAETPAHAAAPDTAPIAPAPQPMAPDSPGFERDDLLSILAQADSMSAPADSHTDDEDSQQAPDLLVSLNRTMSQDLPQHPSEAVLITGRMESTEEFDSAIAPII